MILLLLLVVIYTHYSLAADFSGPEYAFMLCQPNPAKSRVKSLQSLARKKVVNLIGSHGLQPSAFGQEVYKINNPLIHQLVASKLLKTYKHYISAKSITPGALLLPNNPEIVENAGSHRIIFDDRNTLVAHIGNRNDFANIRVWDIHEQKEITHMQHYPERITTLCFNPTSHQFAIGDIQGKIATFNLKGQQLLQLHGHRSPIWTLYYSPDASKIISHTNLSDIRIWAVHNGTCLHIIPNVMLSDGRLLRLYPRTSSPGFYARILREQNAIELCKYNNECLHKIVCPHQPQSASWNKSGNILGVAFNNGAVQLYDRPSYEQAIESIDIRQAFTILNTLILLRQECDAPLHLVRPLGSSHNQLSLYNVPHSFRSVIHQHRFNKQNIKMNQYLRDTLSFICLLMFMGILVLWAPHLQAQSIDTPEGGVLAAKSAAFMTAITVTLGVAERFSNRYYH